MKPTVRCSGLDRRLNCFASPTMEAKLREETVDLGGVGAGSAMTWRGNWCHYDAATRLVNEYGGRVRGVLAKPVLPSDWRPSGWDERTVEWYLANLLVDTADDHIFIVEEHLSYEFERFVLSGHLDCHTLNPDLTEADINDLKTGMAAVDVAEENWQLLGYAVLLKKRYPSLKRVRARIFQRMAEIPVTEVIIEFEGVDAAAYLEKRINASLDQPLLLDTGYKQCRLCECIDFCPAIRKEIESMKHLLTEEEVARLEVVPTLANLAATAAMGRAIAAPIERLLERLKERVSIEGPVSLPDGTQVRLVDAPGRRKVTNTNAAFITLAAKVGEDAAWDTLSLSLSTAEDKLVATGMKRTSKKGESAKGWINEYMHHLIEQPTIKKLLFS